MASSSSSSATEPSSFTTMDKADLDAIGAHCQFAYCHQLDFLPFRCESCKGTFCLDHRTETSHKCANAGAWAAARRKQSLGLLSSSANKPLTTAQPHPAPCAHPACKTVINTLGNTGVHCGLCNRQYCLKHRLREDHDCAKLTPLGARPSALQSQQAERARHALDKFAAWGRAKRDTVLPKKKSSAAERMVALNALKKSAKGNAKIAPEKRIYLHIEAEATTTKSKFPKGDFFYSADWTVGRMLDEAAKGLQVQNVNNRGGGEEDKLRVFHVEGGRLLEFGEKVGDAFTSGNTAVLLRGVGPAVPDLIDM
ncbi:MAG: hypothetical protein M1819_003173 [Sarea resinae]|nr:MAG: hypothetical protein M1819_003173 [Sarea resinae]